MRRHRRLRVLQLPYPDTLRENQMPVTLGSSPIAFGVRFPKDPLQLPWPRFLDEVSAAGYRVIELGPPDYLPTDGDVLEAELMRRGLSVSGGALQFVLGDQDDFERHRAGIEERCALLQRVGASYVVLLDGYYTDRDTGELVARRALEASEWPALIDACDQLMELVGQYGLRAVLHPHADTHVEYEPQVERFLGDSTMGLCFDVGHHAYRGHDPIAFLRRHYDRVEYLHLQTVDVAIQRAVEHDDLSFARAVERGVFVEPWRGAVDFAALASVLDEVGYDGYAIVEQGMYPAPLDKPFRIAQRTYNYLTGLGIGELPDVTRTEKKGVR